MARTVDIDVPGATMTALRTALVAALILASCSRSEEPAPSTASGWLGGTTDERFARVEAQLRGLDVAMVETGHRYAEAYWAGRDRNWPYADYQLQKIEAAIALGIERRPKRAASARMLTPAIAAARHAASTGDDEAWHRAFGNLTATCNACHAAEAVPFIVVKAPEHRLSSVDASSSAKEENR